MHPCCEAVLAGTLYMERVPAKLPGIFRMEQEEKGSCNCYPDRVSPDKSIRKSQKNKYIKKSFLFQVYKLSTKSYISININPDEERCSTSLNSNCRMNKVEMKKRIPYAVANLEEIREENYFFVDKTRFLEELEIYKIPVFLRPRCFGKTLYYDT